MCTYDNAMASDAQTGPSRACLTGYITPAAIGTAMRLYPNAQTFSFSGVGWNGNSRTHEIELNPFYYSF
jgi:hypothetical protein